MSDRDTIRSAAARMLDTDEVEGVLSGSFYSPPEERRRKSVANDPKPQPQHYKVICISMYNSDLESLDQMVETLKSRGLTKANRSALIRYALAQVDLDQVPRGL
jgi:hypothetical protein